MHGYYSHDSPKLVGFHDVFYIEMTFWVAKTYLTTAKGF